MNRFPDDPICLVPIGFPRFARDIGKTLKAASGWRPLSCAMPRGRRDIYRLGLGAVVSAEDCWLPCPATFVIRRTSTRRFLARPEAEPLEATVLSLPSPITKILWAGTLFSERYCTTASARRSLSL